MEGSRLKDLPTNMRTLDPDSFMLEFAFRETKRARKASAIILNTFEDLEHQVLLVPSSMLPLVYSL